MRRSMALLALGLAVLALALGSAAAVTPPESVSQLHGITAMHNERRCQHGARPLAWSPDLAAAAQTYTDQCVFEHSGGGSAYGENIAQGQNSAQEAFDDWYNEVNSCDPASSPESCGGHFTAIVWDTTTELGCGYAACGGSPMWLCRYRPAGNMVGAYAEHVHGISKTEGQCRNASAGSASAASSAKKKKEPAAAAPAAAAGGTDKGQQQGESGDASSSSSSASGDGAGAIAEAVAGVLGGATGGYPTNAARKFLPGGGR